MKKLIIGLAITLVAFLSMNNVAAADVITYQGDANRFIMLDGNAPDFENMLPGESRTVTFNLVNGSGGQMRFYMSSEILDNIANKGDGDAVYTFTIADGTTPFFETEVGNDEVTIGLQFLTNDNNILLGTLNAGASKTINVTLSLDGDSANNEYQGQTGVVNFIFSVEQPLPKIVKTGDESVSPLVYGGLIVAAGLVLILYKRGGKHEK
ncbi:MAG: LPXTG cell wall anchor domain-containing protein [Erysipelotrichaceae bacterium]|nr:LPXTG cell wall anchor domain-containing protein [Erysipelotrichaceae bacterium]MDD3808805.1 LPXTG cell wall anchor domain-containing protein [Erysipelotrichaceae bacterium]